MPTTTDPQVLELIRELEEWHSKRIEALLGLANAPLDTPLELQNEKGEPITVRGDRLAGLKVGARIAAEIFSPFPVAVQSEDSPAANDEGGGQLASDQDSHQGPYPDENWGD